MQAFAAQHDTGITSSSLYWPMAASTSSLGITPASVSWLALIITMNRIVRLLYQLQEQPSRCC